MNRRRPWVTDPLADALSDADLIQRSLGEPGCFAAIFERHADQILRYAHARLGVGSIWPRM